MCNFRVGQKVVCIRSSAMKCNDCPEAVLYAAPPPECGKIYTIRAINDHGNDRILLRFHEVDNRHMVPRFGRIEPGFHYSFFRPVVTRKTSIDIFKKMLNNNTVDA